jgi:hypothetical protein
MTWEPEIDISKGKFHGIKRAILPRHVVSFIRYDLQSLSKMLMGI